MARTPLPTDTTGLRHWHVAHAGPVLVPHGDRSDAKQRLAASIGDDAALARLRRTTLSLADGADLSRLDDHALLDDLAAAVAEGRLRAAGPRPRLLPFVPEAAPAPAPAAPARARRSAPATPDVPPEADLDVAAMVAVLVQAARDGVPFCEECERARAAQAAGSAA